MVDRRQQLEQLDKATLVEHCLLLEKRVETVERQMSELKRALGVGVVKTPQNSSLPPGQGRKANRKAKRRAKGGPKKGHIGTSRRRQLPDEIIECRVGRCGCCGTDLSGLPQHVAGRHQVLDIPPIRPWVCEVVRYGRCCPACHTYQRAAVPTGYERGRVVGPHLEALVLYLHYAHPLSYQRVQHLIHDLLGLQVGMGTLVNIVQRGQAVLQQGAEAIRRRLQQVAVVGSDETGARVDGQNWCQWVFQTPQWVSYAICRSKGARELHAVMGQAQPEVWVSDAGSSQMKHPAKAYQRCLAHLVRAMRLAKHRPRLPTKCYALQVQAIHCHLDHLLKQQPVHHESQTLWRHLHKHRAALLLFLERADVPPTNNASEQALRNSVIYRKVTGGFRSQWAAQLYANLLSILETAHRQGRSIFEIIVSLFTSTPALSWIGE